MKNRDGSISNGYIGSSDHLEDMEAYSWRILGSSLAKEFGTYFYIRHCVEILLKKLYLRLKISNHYYLKNLVEKENEKN